MEAKAPRRKTPAIIVSCCSQPSWPSMYSQSWEIVPSLAGTMPMVGWER